MGKINKRTMKRLRLTKAREALQRKLLLKRLKKENPFLEEGDGEMQIEVPGEERLLESSYSATGEEYEMEGGNSDGDDLEMECKVEIEVEDDKELVRDPLDLTDLEGLPTATVTTSSMPTKRRKQQIPRSAEPKPTKEGGGVVGGNPSKADVCLMCFKDKTATTRYSSSKSSLSSGKDADFLVMFILKKMLEVPNDKLQGYLMCKGNPRKWISFCGHCKVKIDQMVVVQREINELEKKLRRFQREVKDTIALNFVKNKKKVDGFARRKLDHLEVTQETWTHVAKVLPSLSSSLSPSKGQSIVHSVRKKASNSDNTCSSNMDNCNKRKVKLGVHQPPSSKSSVPTLTGDNDDVNTTTLTVEEWLFDKKWSVMPRFNWCSALARRGYRCPICPKFPGMKLEAYVKHILFHNDRPYKCSVCDIHLTGSDLELAKLPQLVHKKEGVPVDHRCRRETLVPVTFQVGNYLECGFCNSESFSSEEERRVHEHTVHNQTSVPLPYDCSKCSSKFRDYTEWRLHRALDHHDLAKLGCFYCDEIFAQRTKEGVDVLDFSARIEHITERHGPKTKATRVEGAECDFCGENFEAGTQLGDHIVADHGLDKNKSVGCPICFARFPSPRRLKIHYRGGIHSDNTFKKKFICDVCGYETVVTLLFQDHKFMKHGIEPEGGRRVLSCKKDNCSFKCVWEKTLKVHMMKEHNAERLFKCETCGKGFLKNSQLKEHQRIHLGIKPFQCEICGNSFALKNYLYIHKRLSHQNRPFASTHKKKAPRKRDGKGFQKRSIGSSQNNSHQGTQNHTEINSQIELQTSPSPNEWTLPPPQAPYQAVDTGNNFGSNYFQDLGSSSSTTPQRN